MNTEVFDRKMEELRKEGVEKAKQIKLADLERKSKPVKVLGKPPESYDLRVGGSEFSQ